MRRMRNGGSANAAYYNVHLDCYYHPINTWLVTLDPKDIKL